MPFLGVRETDRGQEGSEGIWGQNGKVSSSKSQVSNFIWLPTFGRCGTVFSRGHMGEMYAAKKQGLLGGLRGSEIDLFEAATPLKKCQKIWKKVGADINVRQGGETQVGYLESQISLFRKWIPCLDGSDKRLG